MDVGGLIWSDLAIDEAIRLVLRDLQLISPITLTIEGLDGALVTLLEMGMDGLVVRGAAVYALEMRSIDSLDAFELSQTGLDTSNLVDRMKKEYLIDVEKMRVKQFQVSSGIPYFQLPDPDGL
jgi:hypothetical protein